MNHVHGYTSTQILVRNATSDVAGSPSPIQLRDIVGLSNRSLRHFYEIVDMIDKRLSCRNKNWQGAMKALEVLSFCLREGPEHFLMWATKSIDYIKPLCDFQYIAKDGRDVGEKMRNTAREIVQLVLDKDRARQERTQQERLEEDVLPHAELEGLSSPAELTNSTGLVELPSFSSRAELPS